MAKNVRAREDRAALEVVARAMRGLNDIVGILDRTLALESGIDALERRKVDLAAEVSALDQKAEGLRQSTAAAQAATDSERQRFNSLRQAEQDGLHADRATRALAEATEAKAVKERHAAIVAAQQEERARLSAEITALKTQKAALQSELEATLKKYAATR